MTKPTMPPTSPEKTSLIPDTPREESEDAFRKFLEEVDLDDEDAEDIKNRIATLSQEGEAMEDAG